LDRAVDFDDHEFVFVPSAWDFAVSMGVRIHRETDSVALDELADAVLVSMEDRPELEQLTDEAIERIWTNELEAMIREGVAELGGRQEWRDAAAAATVELGRDPRRADVSREVVRHLAMQLAHERTPIFFCLHCLEEGLEHAAAARENLLLAVAHPEAN
jgi:hypothetical protein